MFYSGPRGYPQKVYSRETEPGAKVVVQISEHIAPKHRLGDGAVEVGSDRRRVAYPA
ncbi:MAG: hypothetical protein ACJZ72_00865 [Opitutales bacterium]